jgi:hypothetical protein
MGEISMALVIELRLALKRCAELFAEIPALRSRAGQQEACREGGHVVLAALGRINAELERVAR